MISTSRLCLKTSQVAARIWMQLEVESTSYLIADFARRDTLGGDFSVPGRDIGIRLLLEKGFGLTPRGLGLR